MLEKAFEKDMVGPEVSDQLRQLVSKETLGTLVLVIGTGFVAGAAFAPYGAAALTAFVTALGLLGNLKDIIHLADLFRRIGNAKSYNELEAMLPEFVKVLTKLAVDGALTVLIHKASKSGGKQGQKYEPDYSPGGANKFFKKKKSDNESEVPETTASKEKEVFRYPAVNGKASADDFHRIILDETRKANQGYEIGRHNQFPREMVRKIDEQIKKLKSPNNPRNIDAPFEIERLRQIRKTYERRAGAGHRGGGRGS